MAGARSFGPKESVLGAKGPDRYELIIKRGGLY